MTSLPITIDARGTKGLLLAATADKWTPYWTTGHERGFVIQSQTRDGVSYLTSQTACSCPDSQRTPQRACKHRIAVTVHLWLVDMLASGEIQ